MGGRIREAREAKALSARPLVSTQAMRLRPLLHLQPPHHQLLSLRLHRPQAPLEEATLAPRATLKPGSEVLATMLPMCTRVSSLPMLLVLSPLARPRMRTTLVRSWSPGWTLRATRFGARLSGLS